MRFRAIEHRLPSRPVTNDEVIDNLLRASARHLTREELGGLERLTRDCFTSSGTTVRYVRDEGETAVELAADAGERALASAGLDPGDIDLLIYAGVARGVVEPATAAMHQERLGLHRATSFDVMDACASWLRALQLAHMSVAHGHYRNVMILNAECAGRDSYRYELRSLEEFAHWHPTVTVGEAATVTIVSAGGDGFDDFAADFRSFGGKWDLCFVPLATFEGYAGRERAAVHDWEPMRFVSYGLRLMEFGTRKLIDHYRERPEFEKFEPDIVFGHSASDAASRYVVDSCGIDPGRYRFTHHKYGNTVSASVPLAMSDALASGDLADGDGVMVLMASSGVTTALARFTFKT
ncbi:3-oxoacyl-[acyl-carrier-protein] synthase III [Sinosporangium album]|uniref:3-oxoacyl-[acyl-carrier-protein] synthase III n=1 Tax=Sinosporangium album TaxID=504805 RepID=A0A1G7SHC8_9ACTN|nr:3-oxoacyl-[acyl-carrier-protein] synthase III C-terminal domain-containing protein [Sinosporangium album]SDG22403.1 3-oxoacyl-[acyl-carrier-protein] synthase III [Sinosporangium album]